MEVIKGDKYKIDVEVVSVGEYFILVKSNDESVFYVKREDLK